MTSQTTQIQALIKEIDVVLSKSGPGLLWGLTSEAQQQRTVLVQTRNYLVALLQAGSSASPSLNQYAQAQVPAAESAQQVLQAMMQEMSYLRTNVMQPLRSDLEMLQQQRAALQQEVRQLEAQRQQYELPPVNQQMMDELMRSLMARVQERLSTQLSQMGTALPSDSTETDQLVLKLDASLRVMFESLQADLQSYQRSLSAGLEKMHTLGQQSEAIFAALVNRLAQQLGREASGYLRPGEGVSDVQIDRLLSELGLPNTAASASSSPQLSMTPAPDLLNVELEPLPSSGAIEEEITLLQTDPLPSPPVDEEITLFQMDAPPAPAQTDAADAELDNFYESLFGDRALPYTEAATESQIAAPAIEPEAVEPAIEPETAAPETAAPEAIEPEAAPTEDSATEPEDLDSLFANLDAPSVPAADSPAAEPAPPTSPQSLESFLFTSPEPEAVPEIPDAADVASSGEEEPFRVTSLSELIDQTTPEISPVDTAATLPTSSSDVDEDTYIPAPPEEDLLVGQATDDRTGLDFQLNDEMLRQLSTDLSNLEAGEPPLESAAELSELEASVSPSLDLDDLFDSEPATDLPADTSFSADVAFSLEGPLDLFAPPPDELASDAELRDLLAIHTPPDAPPDLPPDAPPPEPVPSPDAPPDLPLPLAVTTNRLAADVDDLFPLTVTPPVVETPAAVAEAQVAIEPVEPALESLEPAIEPVTPAIEPIESVESLEPVEPVEPALESLAPTIQPVEPAATVEAPTEPSADSAAISLEDLFSENASILPESLASTDSEVEVTSSPEAELTLEDLFVSAADTPELTGTADLALDDLAADLPVQAESAPEPFDAIELEELLDLSPTEAPEVEPESATPSLAEQALLGELLFADTPALPEPLAPEEAGLTLDSLPLDQPSAAATESALIDVTPLDQPEQATAEEVFSPFDLDEADAEANQLTLDDFLIDRPSEGRSNPEAEMPDDLLLEELPLEELPPEYLPAEDLSPEENAFSLEGLDRLFEDAPESEPEASSSTNAAIEKKNTTITTELVPPAADTDWIELPTELEPDPSPDPSDVDSEPIAAALTAPLAPAISTIAASAEEDTVPFDPPESHPPASTGASANVWSLGLDIGTTGISAVLLNRLSCELFPIYWAEGSERTFRLPTRVYSSEDGAGSIASTASTRITLMPLRDEVSPSSVRLLQNFKPDLRLGIPHYSPETKGWEPVVQWSNQQTVNLSVIHQGLQTLLVTLSTQRSPVTAAAAPLSCGAVGLETGAFQMALQQLAQVIVGYPINCSDTYSLNIREAILGARLVAQPEQVCFVEDAIAAVLSGLRSADGRTVILPSGLAQKSQLHNTDWQGGTLAISAGAIATELAIVDFPETMTMGYRLSYADFTLRSLAYGGNAIDQDIVCQLLYPTRFRQPRRSQNRNLLGAGEAAPTGSDGGNWQTDPQVGTWEGLALADLMLPLPGEPDAIHRLRLQQHLESSPFGQHLLEAARHLKLILQHQDQFTFELGDQQWRLTRQDLGSQVILPYIQRLNRELNALLSQTGMPLQAIQQVICTGGTASLRAIARWLRQKLPNATIIQDTYARVGAIEPRSLTCSRIAYGLATLPLHPQVLDLPRQQYSDYFLLLELLRALPDQPLTAGAVMQLLERRGINTQACHGHVLALLEGHLPPGLVPTEQEADALGALSERLAAVSRQNPEYAVLLTAPLFHKLDQQTYQPNPEQWQRFEQYLSTLLASTHQTLAEPLTLHMG